tara:strand:- start:22354 stop:22578 length:225 start_codon:yes stop_codon:yes gene_type:complete
LEKRYFPITGLSEGELKTSNPENFITLNNLTQNCQKAVLTPAEFAGQALPRRAISIKPRKFSTFNFITFNFITL